MMNKKLQVLFFSIFVIFTISCKNTDVTPTAVTQTNLLVNGDIEGGSSNWYFGSYPQYNSNGYTSGVSNEFSASPKSSLKINCEKVINDSILCFFSQTFPTTNLKTGAKLSLKVKIKGVNLTGEGLSIAFRGDKTGVATPMFFQTSQGITSLKGTFDFKEVTVSLDSYAGNADKILVFLVYLPQTTGAAYFDDISLTTN
jgi:hypothetical protein